jgi:teichuronic acid biosynthesis glycosyltransferase TuaG
MEKVSIIVTVYNCEKYIYDCLTSVINQTYKNLEIIVVDDCSTDNSLNVIKTIKDKRIKLVKLKKNYGTAVARNRGVYHSTGRYLCFLDGDDYWNLDKIEKQLKFIKDNKYIFVFSSYSYLRNNKLKVAKVPSKMNYDDLLKNHAIFTSSVMLDMNYLQKEDIKMPKIKRGQDMATWWKILKSGVTAYSISEPLAIYRVGNKSLSSNKLIAVSRTWKLFKREKLSFIKRLYCYICYILNAIKRRISL